MQETKLIEALYLPGRQAGQVVAPDLSPYRPGVHDKHDCEPVFAVYVPLSQGWHLTLFTLDVYLPFAQGVHSVLPIAEDLPATQSEHSVWPSFPWYFPA